MMKLVYGKFLVAFGDYSRYSFLIAMTFGLIMGISYAYAGEKLTAYSPYGDIKYGDGKLGGKSFNHFDYVNPDAPHGGQVITDALGGFDSFNPFIIQGNPANGLGMIFASLLTRSADEPSTSYSYVADWFQLSDDHKGVIFHIRDQAVFHDGSPLTAADVAWSFERLVKDGTPTYALYYASIAKVNLIDKQTIQFTFKEVNRELPAILGEFPIFSQKDWQGHEFSKPRLDPPLGSGPWKVGRFEFGSFVEYERVKQPWLDNLAVSAGLNNFSHWRYEYFRDRNIAREAFKAGKLNYFFENSAKNWATAYDSPRLKSGEYRLAEFPESRVAPMQGFVFNLRKPIFQDARLREALTYAFDFEWANKTLMYNAYHRTQSYFDNSELAAVGKPSEAELALLKPLASQLDPRVLEGAWVAPISDGGGQNRDNLRKAAQILKDAGWVLDKGVLTKGVGGPILEFEILLYSDTLVPHTQVLQRGIEKLGGKLNIRIVDTSQYTQRVSQFDYDMMIGVFAQSESPGNEQRNFWATSSADQAGSQNYAGLKNAAIDNLVENLIKSNTRAELVTRTRVLDRALQWSFLVIPMFHGRSDRYALDKHFTFPSQKSPYGPVVSSWWWSVAN